MIQDWATAIHHRLATQTQPQNRDEEILAMYINMNTKSWIAIQGCMMAEEKN